MSQASGRPITAEELLRLADGDLREQIEERDRLAEIKVGKADRECEQHKPRPSQATMLVELASQASACLFHAADGEAYAGVTVGGHHETHRLKAKSFRRWLTREFHIVHGKAPSGQAQRDALAVLERRALYDGPEQPVAVRLAGHGDAIYLDLADRDWR